MQSIQYSGITEGDFASINLTNNNNETINYVTIKVSLPILKKGNYSATGGEIVKNKIDNNNQLVYVTTNLPAFSSKQIIINPEIKREKMVVKLPDKLVEGTVSISIKEENGNPLRTADVIVDSDYYQPDMNGNVDIVLKRGVHSIKVQNPGFETFSSDFKVRGRILLIEDLFLNYLK